MQKFSYSFGVSKLECAEMAGRDTTIGGSAWEFPSTIWSIVLNAKNRNTAEYQKCLDKLVSMYWKPVYRYIRIAWNKSNEDSKDLTQEFFSKFLEKDYLKPVSPEKGKFRQYIKVALKHFLINQKLKEQAKKRGGDVATLRVEDLVEDPTESKSSDPSDLFDKEWAKMVISKSMKLLKDRLVEGGKSKYYKVFEMYYISGEVQNSASSQYMNISEKLGIKHTDIRNYLTYSRKIMKDIVKDEIRQYVLDKSDVEEELKYLMSMQL